MSKINVGRLIDQRSKQEAEARKPVPPLCVIPDSEVLTRETFKQYLRKYPKAKKFAFSCKHTAEIAKMRDQHGVDHHPDKIYSLPVLWDQTQTYIA